MDIRLNRLSIKNFKGIKSLDINFDGKNTAIRGDNATFKSSTYDAYSWLVTGKDSFNRADFGIKPLDENGQEIHFLETEVEAEFLVDVKPLKLKKVQTENWVRPRGATEQEYKGNNTAYFYDEVPVGATVYKEKVDNLIGEETFRLLTNPLYFNQYYKLPKLTDWQSRRMLLFEMCGDISDETIIQMNPDLAMLPEVLDGKSIDDRKAIIAQSIKKLNEQIVVIGPKINENMRLIPEIATDYTATEQELKRLKSELETIEKELAGAGDTASTYRKKQQELYSLKNQLENVKSRIYKESNVERQRTIERKTKLESEKFSEESTIKQHNRAISENNQIIEGNAKRRETLIGEWKRFSSELQEAQAQQFIVPDDDFICPTCNQSLPEEDKQKKLEEMKANFESHKAIRIKQAQSNLEANVSAGKAIVAENEELKQLNEKSQAVISNSEAKLVVIKASLKKIEDELDKPTAEPNYNADAEYVELSGKIRDLQAELDKPIEDTTAEIRERKWSIAQQIEDCNRILNNKHVAEDAKARIEELKQSEKDLSNQKSQLEGQLNLITEFIKAKANTLTDIMNSKFKHVKFELFETQINGNMVECCNTLVNTNSCWVPFSDGNTAGRINAGIDIVNALSKHYGVRVPLWVDNRESITTLADTESQVISLIKPDIQTAEDKKKYSKLVVETEDK